MIFETIYNDFRQGNIDSFYDKMYPELVVYVSKILGLDYAFLAEDCVQNAVVKAYHHTAEFKSHIQWRVWLYTCIRNEAVTILRHGHAQSNFLDAQSSDQVEDVSLDMVEQETLTVLYDAIASLPEKQQAIFRLTYEEGLKIAEIAQRLGIAEITVKKQKAQMLQQLRDSMREHMDDTSIVLLMLILSTTGQA